MPARTISTIKQYLYALVAAAVLAMLAIFAYSLYSNVANAVAQEKSRLRAIATIIANNTSSVIEKNRDRLQRIAQRPAIQAMDIKRCDPILDYFPELFPQYANLTTVDLEGNAPCSAVPQPGGKPVSIAKASWFQKARAEHRFVVGNPFLGPITGKWVSVMLEPVWNAKHQLRGFLGLPLDLQAFDPNVSDNTLPSGTRYGILSGDGTLVWRNVDPDQMIGKDVSDQPAPKLSMSIRNGEFESVGTDGNRRYYSVVPIPIAGWYAYVGIESSHVYAASLRTAAVTSAAGLLGLIAVGALFLFLVRRIGGAEEELRQAMEAAVAANRAKSIFLSNMSHELRTPLNAILGFAQLMERDAAVPEHQRRNLKTVNRSGRHLLSLINDILEISKIEAGRLVASEQVCDLPEMLSIVTESMALRAKGKGLALQCAIDASLPRFVRTDIAKLRQIILNLLSNAVKYTNQGGITLSASATQLDAQAQIRLVVRDTGMGIAAAELERIFQPFYQTQDGIKVGEGTGLGLSIAREYAQLLGGSLAVESAPGQGSTFTLLLPATVASEALPVMAASRQVLGLAPGQRSFRILIAEDKEDNQRLLAELMQSAGFEVRVAANGSEAVALFRHWRPDLIWMDMRMPVLDGYAATREIRALEGGATLPIIAVTASAFEEDRAAILATGCTDMVRKPLEADELFALMVRHLEVKFLYAEAGEAVEQADRALTAAELAALPSALREDLARAAVALDAQAVRAIADQIEAEQAQLALLLRGHADNYRFDLLDPTPGPPAAS